MYLLARGPNAASQEEPAEQIAQPEEDQDHDRHHEGDDPHHLKQLRARLTIHLKQPRRYAPGRELAAMLALA